MFEDVVAPPAAVPAPAERPAGGGGPRRPRICFVGLQNLPVLSTHHAAHGIGGEQVQQTLLARAFARRGFEVSMVVADYGQPEGLELEGIRLHKAYRLEAGVPVLRFVHPRLSGLWAALARSDADVYYVSIAGPQVGFVTAFARRHGRRVVFRIASDADCDPRHPLIRLARDRWLYRWGLMHADRVLAQTEQQVQALQVNHGVVSQPALMLVEEAPPPLALAQRDIDVLWVSNLLPLKRPEAVLDLARRLPQLRFHMVGGAQPGHEALYEHVRHHAAGLRNLRFHGRVPYQETAALFDRARVFVNTSEVEGFPNAFLQAWRRGIPTISHIDPDRTIGRHGLGAAVDSLDAMARELAALGASSHTWTQASLRCRRYMQDRYDEDAVLQPYLEALAPVARPVEETAA